MNSFNNFGTFNNFNSVAPNQNTFNGIDTKRFANISTLNDISDLMSKGNSEGLQEEEFNELIILLRSLNVEVDIEYEEITPGKMPSVLSSTDAYTKVFKALMEVLAKLREEEERHAQKNRNEIQMAIQEQELAEIKKDMDKTVEMLKSKEVKKEIIIDKNFTKINQFFDDIRDKYNIDIKSTISNPINAII